MQVSIKLEDPATWRRASECLADAQNLDAHFQKAVLAELQFFRKKIIEGFKSEAPGGRKWAPLKPVTLAIRAFEGFKGTKILQVSRDLIGSISVIPIAENLGGFVGVARSAARKDGKDPVNVARIQEEGRTYTAKMTDRQRRYIFAALAAAGIRDEPTAGGARGGGAVTIRIPPRPFISPIFDQYGDPDAVAESILARVCLSLKGALGKPDGGATPRR